MASFAWLVIRILLKFIFKSDGEPALAALKTAAISRCVGRDVTPKETPRGDWKSHGEIEVAIRDIRRQARTLKAALCQKWQLDDLPVDHCITSWLVGYAAFLLCRIPVGSDGQTPFERFYGRKFKRELAIFGEHCMWRSVLRKDSDKNLLKNQWFHGIFVGVNERNDEIFVLTPQGAQRASSVKRLADPTRWDRSGAGDYLTLKGTPWDRLPRVGNGMTPVSSQSIPTPIPAAAPPPASGSQPQTPG